jgi:hypothetical protein
MKPVTRSQELQLITPDELARIGLSHLAYIRPTKEGYVIHAADGMAIAAVESLEQAFEAIEQNEMLPVTLH